MLSVLIVCRQVDDMLLRTITSVEALKPQILIDISSGGKEALGVRKNRLISQAAYEWVLILDTDEVVSMGLMKEIRKVMNDAPDNINGYEIQYQNYAFGKILRHGGERFAKTRLIKKSFGKLSPFPIHEEIVINGTINTLSEVIYHNSYRSFGQVINKFTRYAWQMAGEKRKARESVTLKKLFLYGPHMVWARAIKDEGWRDGWRGILLAFCFGYMEMLTYWFLLWRNIFHY